MSRSIFLLNNIVAIWLLSLVSIPAWANSMQPTTGMGLKHRVVSVEGTAEKLTPDANHPQRLRRNAQIENSDIIRLEANSSVEILCSNGQRRTWNVAGSSGVRQVCGESPAVDVARGRVRPRGSDRAIPYAISPRATHLLTDRPILRWNNTVNTHQFSVQIRGGNSTFEAVFVNQGMACQNSTCELTYPEVWPSLQSEISYRLIVESDIGRSSSEESIPGLGFKLLDPDNTQLVTEIQAEILGNNYPATTEALALADMYASFGLIEQAIVTLENLPNDSKTIEVYRLLGDLYSQIGLALLAEEHYLSALNLYSEENEVNLDELARAYEGLAIVELALGKNEQAISNLTNAISTYRRLGNTVKIGEITTTLQEL